MTYKNIIKNKNIILGITGSIAAYKSIFLASLLVKEGANVQVIMSQSSKEFVGESSFSGITHNSVITGYYGEKTNLNIDHIELAKKADIIVIAPATANTIAKLALGISDNPIIGSVLATSAPILIAPAMDGNMYKSKQVTENIKKLLDDKTFFTGPDKGRLASGINEKGRMSEPEEILDKIKYIFSKNNDYKNVKSIVTAGGTREAIDPVRFITNRSSGKQGFELAKSLSKKGFETTLISGPTNLKAEKDINFIKVETADQMFKATQNSLPADVAIFSAAVADFKVKEKKEQKIKKEDYINLNLEKNIDIINYVSNHNSLRPRLVIGFAAETNNIKNNAKKKLMEKNCDWIIANDVSNRSIGFDSDFNEVTIFYKNEKINDEKLFMKKKSEISDEIIDRVIGQLN